MGGDQGGACQVHPVGVKHEAGVPLRVDGRRGSPLHTVHVGIDGEAQRSVSVHALRLGEGKKWQG